MPEGERPPPLAIRGLSIRYGTRTAVDRLTLTVRPGEIYGLLGANGAGKSSTMRAIVGLLPAYGGSIRVLGFDPIRQPIATKARIGYVPETPLLFEALTGREFLEFVAGVRRIPSEAVNRRLAPLAHAFQVDEELDHPTGTLSMGTRQKFLMIAALLHRPPLLVLDEPLHALDPRAVRVAREVLRQQASEPGHGILLSTHTMEIAERLCDRIGILDEGRLCGEGTLAELLGTHSANLEEAFLRLTREGEGVREAVRALGSV
jgi:ABC-2 type transport system ATP-binding protein